MTDDTAKLHFYGEYPKFFAQKKLTMLEKTANRSVSIENILYLHTEGL